MAFNLLRRFDLTKDKVRGGWKLKERGANHAVCRFATKSDATKGDALSKAIGEGGGSVRIHKQDGWIEEERTYPRGRDPERSKG